jgi:hypothetical protein
MAAVAGLTAPLPAGCDKGISIIFVAGSGREVLEALV